MVLTEFQPLIETLEAESCNAGLLSYLRDAFRSGLGLRPQVSELSQKEANY
jgi:hypothetical protein